MKLINALKLQGYWAQSHGMIANASESSQLNYMVQNSVSVPGPMNDMATDAGISRVEDVPDISKEDVQQSSMSSSLQPFSLSSGGETLYQLRRGG